MKNTFAWLGTNCFALVLSACGSGGDSPDTVDLATSYVSLQAQGETISNLGGVSIRSNGKTGELQILVLSGSKDQNTGETTVTDGTYILKDNDGFDNSGNLTDGQSNLSTQAMPNNYAYSTAFDQSYSVDDVSYSSTGIVGISTTPSVMPTSGSVLYSGQSEALIVTASQGFSLQGKSTVEANFSGIGSVDVRLNGFTATDMATGKTTSAPIDEIAVTGMTITENRFSEGFIITRNDGAIVSVTGANTSAVAEGMLFGYDSTISAPDEVGGMILIEGEDGIIVGSFLAD